MNITPTTGVTIRTVAERTGVSVHTLRAWERRYGVPKPNRLPSNRYRLYDEQDIADVLWLKQQVAVGVAPAQATRVLEQQRRARLVGVAVDASLPSALQSALETAFVQSDMDTARVILDRVFAELAPEQALLQVIQPAVREVGNRWMRNEMTVWQEHLASQAVRQKLHVVLESQPALPQTMPLLVAACAPGEEHELGLLMFALLARQQGWRVTYLGRSTPLGDLSDLARAAKPNWLAVSLTTVSGLSGLIPWLSPAQRPNVPLLFGGRLPALLPSLRAHLPGTCLGDDALAVVRGLVTCEPAKALWTPPKRVWQATHALRAQRFKIASEVVAQLLAGAPMSTRRGWQAADLNYATLYLLDALSCALVFAVPELMDVQKAWLEEAMLPRQVSPQLIRKHIEMVGRELQKNLTPEEGELAYPLLERLADYSFV